MLQLNTIRYMGNKSKLLDYIIPEIQKATPENGCVCDLMGGSNVVGYALKEFFTVYTNDVQEYSKVISDAVIVNQTDTISSISAEKYLYNNYSKNKADKEYSFFEDVYANTYFSKEQCADIDSIRYAIERIENKNQKDLFLFALMNAMCTVQSTPGHFAQFMPATHQRIIPLQKMNVWDEFLKKCDLYADIYFSDKKNKSFCCDYRDLLKADLLHEVDTIYLDSPYSQEQYSRFYHILETVVKYDCPKVDFKAKYRIDRFLSKFCYKKSVEDEFSYILQFCQSNNKNIVISYSNHALLQADKLLELCKEYFSDVNMQNLNYEHSTQGKGKNKITEIIITCINKRPLA